MPYASQQKPAWGAAVILAFAIIAGILGAQHDAALYERQPAPASTCP